MSCAACCAKITEDDEHLQCSNDNCCKLYHFACAGVRSLHELCDMWVCPECCCSAKKGGDNSSTPVGLTKKPVNDDYVTYRKKLVTPCSIHDSSCIAIQQGDTSTEDVKLSHQEYDRDYVTYRKEVVLPCLINNHSITMEPCDISAGAVKSVRQELVEPYSINDSSIAVEHSKNMAEDIKLLRQEICFLTEQLNKAVKLITNCESTVTNCAAEVKQFNGRLENAVTVINTISVSQAQILQQLSTTTKLAQVSETLSSHTEVCSQHVENMAISPTILSADKPIVPMVTDAATSPTKISKKRKYRKSGSSKKLATTAPASPVVDSVPSPAESVLLPITAPAYPVSETSLSSSENYLQNTHEDKHQTMQVPGVSTISNHSDDEPWIEVKEGKQQKPASLRGTAGPSKTTLKAIEPRKYVHLWNMASNIDDIKAYLRQIWPTETCTVQELTPRGDYKSYKLGVPFAAYDLCFSSDAWPVNARIKAWIPYQRPVGVQNVNRKYDRSAPTMARNNQPFREPRNVQEENK